jgi:hypothetical protein
MSLDWMVQLAASGGAALAGAAGTDAWKFARAGFARVFGRADPDRGALTERRLEASATEVEQAPHADRPEVRARQQVIWQTRLADLLEEDPAVADDLRSVVAQLIERLPAAENHWVMNVTASAPNATAQGVQHGNIINH